MSIEEKVKAIITENLALDKEPRLDDDVYEDLGADSLDGVEIILEIEDFYGIEIDDETGDQARTVKDFIKLATNKEK